MGAFLSPSASLARAVLSLVVLLLVVPNSALAEGTDELMPSIGADGGRLGLYDTEVFADIVDSSVERLCLLGVDSVGGRPTVDISAPGGAPVATDVPLDGRCVTLTSGNGAYRIHNFSRTLTSTARWDFSVCDSGEGACDSTAANAAHVDGRIYAYRWIFNSTPTQRAERAVTGSVFARVPIGAFGVGVVELRLNGVHGLSRWEILANGVGVNGISPTRSVRAAGRTVSADYRIYLNLPDPAVEAYGVPEPRISDLAFVADAPLDCGAIEPGRNEGTLSYRTNMPGAVRFICDIDGDDVFDPAGAVDLVVSALAVLGDNTLTVSGMNGEGMAAPAGTYDCVTELTAGEFHYVAEDIEVAYPGLRMFRVDSAMTRTPIPMYWNDGSVAPAMPLMMPNGEVPNDTSPIDGLPSGAYLDPAEANSTTRGGNARGWGQFADSGSVTGSRGDMNLLDTWTGLTAARSLPVEITIIGVGADCDMSGGTDFEELCVLGTDPCSCDEDAHCEDGNECTADSCAAGECSSVPFEAGTVCSTGVCDGLPSPMCIPCLVDADCADGMFCVDQMCVGDGDDDNDGILNHDECPLGLAMCADRDGDGMVNYLDPDDDGDGIPTRDERPGLLDRDTDGNGESDHLDPDDDGDSISTMDEVLDGQVHGDDVDGDGLDNWLDPDSDAEGEDDRSEGRGDEDGDGVPNYLDPTDSRTVPPVEDPGFTGGASGCQCDANGKPQSVGLWALLLSVVFMRRRRR